MYLGLCRVHCNQFAIWCARKSSLFAISPKHRAHLFELVADEREGLVDGVCVPGQGHDPLRAGSVADVDLGSTLDAL